MLAGSPAIGALPQTRYRDRLFGAIRMIPRVELDFDADIGHRIVRGRRRRGFPLLIVLLTLIAIADDVVRIGKLFVLRLGYLVAWIPIRMETDGLFPEGPPDLVGSGALLNAQDRVVVRFTGHPNILSCTQSDREKIGS